MLIRDIIFSSGKKQTTITAYSKKHRESKKQAASRAIKWEAIAKARDRTLGEW